MDQMMIDRREFVQIVLSQRLIGRKEWTR